MRMVSSEFTVTEYDGKFICIFKFYPFLLSVKHLLKMFGKCLLLTISINKQYNIHMIILQNNF